MARRHGRNLTALPTETREYVAENMKERIYATITLLAVIVSLWQTAGHHTVPGAVASIVGTVLALWLATLVSARMSHRAVHREGMSERSSARLLFASSGLFAPAAAPVVLLLVSGTGLIGIRAALTASVAALLLSLFLLSFVAARRIYGRTGQVVLISLAEMLVGIGVVALKLVTGE
jgi:hypothetical protein